MKKRIKHIKATINNLFNKVIELPTSKKYIILIITLLFLITTNFILHLTLSFMRPTDPIYKIGQAMVASSGVYTNSILLLTSILVLLYVYKVQNKILAKSAAFAEEQLLALKKQKFESTFFEMLARIDSIVNNMVQLREKKTGKMDISGRVFLKSFVEDFLINFSGGHKIPSHEKIISEEPHYSIPGSGDYEYWKKEIINTYIVFFNSESSNLGHYFRYIHNIIKYVLSELGHGKNVEMSNENQKEIRKYLGILQAQLSNDELAIIFYNCLSPYCLNQEGRPQFKEWVDEFQILENIGERFVVLPQLLCEFPNTVFWCKDKFEKSNE
jgi:hypothetical protein